MHENSSTAILHALMRAQQVSPASLGPAAGDSLDLSALDASIREEAEMFSKLSSAVSVHSGTADLDIMEPEATACVSPRADDVRGSPRALLSRSSSAVSVYSGRADFDIMADACGEPQADDKADASGGACFNIVGPVADAWGVPQADDRAAQSDVCGVPHPADKRGESDAWGVPQADEKTSTS